MRDDFSRAKFMFLHSLDPKRTVGFNSPKVFNLIVDGNNLLASSSQDI